MEKRRIENCLEIRLISPKERASLNKNPNPNQRNEWMNENYNLKKKKFNKIKLISLL